MGNYFAERLFNRTTGREPLGELQPMPAPDPMVMESGPDTAYTPRQNPLNVLGSRLLGIAEDPRNAWIGMGGVAGIVKGPKALYHIIDGHTGQIVGQASSLKRASQSVDKRDLAYGATRFFHKRIEEAKQPIVGKLDDEIPMDAGELVKPPTVEGMRQAHFYEKAGDDLKGFDRPSKSFGYDQYMEIWPTRADAVKRWGNIPEEQMRVKYKEFLKDQKRQNAEKLAER
jgi:hypothetical protein